MKALLRRMAMLLMVTALGGLTQAETTTKSSSSSKGGTTSKAKAKAKPAAADDDGDAPKPKPKPKAAVSDDEDDLPKAKSKPKAGEDDEKPKAGSAKSKNSVKDPDDNETDGPKSKAPRPAAVTSINVDELSGFDNYPKQVRSLVESAVALTHLGLTYTFGSSEPNQGGMDCSGTMYHVLRFQGLKDVPRQSDEMCAWVRDHSRLHLTPTASTFSDAEFEALRPGDLLFWTGTMETSRKLPVTHVMLYLGKLKSNGKRVVFGSSDGRTYEGNRRCGVSVFDFSLPKAGGKAAFFGYGPAPGLATPEALALEEIRKAEVPAPPASKPLVDGEKLFASKNKSTDQPQPLPQADPPTTQTDKQSTAAMKPEIKGVEAKSSSQALKTPASDEASETKKLVVKNRGDDARTASPAADKKKPREAATPDDDSAARRQAARNTSDDEDKPRAAESKPKSSASITATAKSKTAPTAHQADSPAKKSTPRPVAQRTPAKKKTVPQSTESKPAKVVREVVDSIRGAFRN